MKRTILYSLTGILAAFTLLAAGNRSTKFSAVLEGGFDPAREFHKHGYAVHAEARGEGIRNSEAGYGWQSWCGVLTCTNGPTTSNAAAQIIRDELNRSLNASALDELTGRASPDDKPLTGMLRYNKDAVHGDMHVWLTPVVSNTSISYVIFVREERLK